MKAQLDRVSSSFLAFQRTVKSARTNVEKST
jgi:hypothetical protein